MPLASLSITGKEKLKNQQAFKPFMTFDKSCFLFPNMDGTT
jgi:hypothetical protein